MRRSGELRPVVSSLGLLQHKQSAEVDAHQIKVTTRDHLVVLSGNVRSWSEREEAERAAWAAPGVVRLENMIVVEPERQQRSISRAKSP